MSRRLTTIAAEINTLPGFTASVEKVRVDTDRLVQNGGRHLRVPGKGKMGNQITVVHDRTGRKLLIHNSAAAYRSNDEVEHWLAALRSALDAGVVSEDSVGDPEGGTLGSVELHQMLQAAREAALAAEAVLTEPLRALIVEMLQRGVAGLESGASRASSDWGRRDAPSTWQSRDARIQINEVDAKHLTALGLLQDSGSGTCPYTLTVKGVETALPHVAYTPLNVQEVIEYVLDLDYFHPCEELGGEVAIPALYKPGTSNLVLVLGENAGGKSFFRRLVRLVTHRGRKGGFGDPKITPGPFPVREFIPLCMQDRTSSNFGSSMIYGVEDIHSTGECSSRTVSTGISTVSGRTHPTIIWWDEPDIGMSAGAAAGAGLRIKQFVESEAPLVQAICVTSHSVPLIRQLADLDPHYIYLGNADGPATLEDWYKAQDNPTPVMPEELQEISHRRFRMIQKILNRAKEQR